MTITERVMGLGDWSIRLSEQTPPSVLDSIKTPFAMIVVTYSRLEPSVLTDAGVLLGSLYSGVVLRPGPQRQLGGAGLAWYLGDDKGGAGVAEGGFLWSATTNSDAVADIVAGTQFVVGAVTDLNPVTLDSGLIDRRTALSIVAANSGYEWRVTSDLNRVDLGPVTSLYGTDPTAVVVRRNDGRELAEPIGITGRVDSTWDWTTYGSKVYVWSNQGYGSSGAASPYYDPAGNQLTIVRGYEEPSAPVSSEATIAGWWLDRINRTVRTVEISTENYAVTADLTCGGSVWLYDPDQGLYDPANQVQFQGSVIAPVSARVQAVTWPVTKGMGVYYRYWDGASTQYVDLTDWVEWESGESRYEISTSAQSLAPPTSSPGLQAYFSPWQEFTPTWYAITTQPAIGNGTLRGRFRRLGTSLEVVMAMETGTTTTFGTGGYYFSLPPGCLGASGNFNQYLNWSASDSTNTYTGLAVVPGTVSTATLLYGNPAGGVDAATPIAWAGAPAGSRIDISGTLEVHV